MKKYHTGTNQEGTKNALPACNRKISSTFYGMSMRASDKEVMPMPYLSKKVLRQFKFEIIMGMLNEDPKLRRQIEIYMKEEKKQ